jgi:glycosyltransferase involved in cell wall biosynthesis
VRIGVVMPTYNHAAYLPETLESMEAQTYEDCGTLVVVNDGSTDGTREILKRNSNSPKWNRKTITRSVNGGCHAAINAGLYFLDLDAALSWVSSDNVMYPDWLSTLSAALKSGVGAVYSAFDMPGHKGKTITVRPGPYDPDRLVSSENCYFGPSFLIRAEIWRAAGDHEGGSAHDYGHWARVEEACWDAGMTIEYVDKPLCWYRVHPEQTVKRRPDLYDAPEQRRKALERRAASGR